MLSGVRRMEVGRIASVRLLRVLRLALVDRLFGRQVVGGEVVRDVTADLGDGFVGQVHRVGTHIGDQTDGLAADVHAFVQRLRGAHRAVGGHAELAHGLLLQRRGREGCCGIALLAPLLDADDLGRQLGVGQFRVDRVVLGLAADRELVQLLALVLEQLWR